LTEGTIVVVPVWAVHISEGVLSWPWLLGGFVLTALLMLAALPGLRTEEELPRIALLTAAFFVASLLHVKLGPTSVHLLFNGLVGVVLGRRAALAIPVGLVLQAALLQHGGFGPLGVNACVMTLPALAAGVLCRELHRGSWLHIDAVRMTLVGLAVLVWLLALVFSVAVLCTNPLTGLVARNVDIGFQLRLPEIDRALIWTFHPVTLAAALVLAAVAAWVEHRLGQTPEFALGMLLGLLTVLATATLNALVLLWGGIDDFHTLVVFVFLAHLPLAVLEGIVLGFMVHYLSQVKPDLLGLETAGGAWSDRAAAEPTQAMHASSEAVRPANPREVTMKPPLLFLLAGLGLAFAAQPAFAHRLEADYRVLPLGRIQVESWFETGDTPKKATVQVFGPDGKVRAEGPLSETSGTFVFRPKQVETLRIVVNAPGGHRKELIVPAEQVPAPRWWHPLTVPDPAAAVAGPGPGEPSNPEKPGGNTESSGSDGTSRPGGPAGRETRSGDRTWTDVIAGLGFLLGLAAFVLVLLQRRTIGELRRELAALRERAGSVSDGAGEDPSLALPAREARRDYFPSGKTSSSGTSH
jgi:cobalt/nickel transport system permease protein